MERDEGVACRHDALFQGAPVTVLPRRERHAVCIYIGHSGADRCGSVRQSGMYRGGGGVLGNPVYGASNGIETGSDDAATENAYRMVAAAESAPSVVRAVCEGVPDFPGEERLYVPAGEIRAPAGGFAFFFSYLP